MLRFSKSLAPAGRKAFSSWTQTASKPWGSVLAPEMYVSEVNRGESWQPGKIIPYGDLSISPISAVLNYGQAVLEGMKIQLSRNGDLIGFRPEENAKRFAASAKRLSMPEVPEKVFIDAVKQIANACERQDIIPPFQQGSLYLRPLLLGTGSEVLGVNPAPSYTFVIVASPVPESYAAKGTGKMFISDEFSRVGAGGLGGVKVAGNYASTLLPIVQTRKDGYDSVIFLDAVENKYLEEVGTSNLFFIKNDILYTPELNGNILPGITRDSVITMAKEKGMEVQEKKCSIDDFLQADEAFNCGTAVLLAPIKAATFNDKTTEFGVGPRTKEFREELVALQSGEMEDKFNWIRRF